MTNQRTTFAKRQREQNKKDKFAAKQQRLAARRAEALAQRDAPPTASSLDRSDGGLDGAVAIDRELDAHPDADNSGG